MPLQRDSICLGFVIHIVSVLIRRSCSDYQWVTCGTRARSAFLICKIIKVKTADITVLHLSMHASGFLFKKLHKWDMTKALDHYNLGEMKRTMAHIKSMLPLKKHSEIHTPLLNIELDHVIIDELHLMMRVAGCLTENLITEVTERDCNNINKGRGENKGIYLESLVTTINKIGIPFSLWAKKIQMERVDKPC